jgi:hypothetical protein
MTKTLEEVETAVDTDLLFGKFSYLLSSLIFLLVAASLIGHDRLSCILFCLLMTGVLLVSAVTICRHHKNLVPALFLAIPTIFFNWLGFATTNQTVFVVHNLLLVLFFGFVAYHVLYSILADERVTLDTIRGAVCIYLLVGLAWTYVYGTMQLVDSGAIEFPGTDVRTTVSAFGNSSFTQTAYYSFTTMTTLGFGDIHPVLPPARTASILQAIFGQFYLAVLVARLVVLHIHSRIETGNPRE